MISIFAFIGFIGTMMNMEADLKDSSMESDTKYFVLEDHIEWENRLERLSPVGIVAHDSKPETNLFEIVLTATYQDVNNDDLTYSWEHLNSWDNGDDRNSDCIKEIKWALKNSSVPLSTGIEHDNNWGYGSVSATAWAQEAESIRNCS